MEEQQQAIVVSEVSKRFNLPHERNMSIKSSLVNLWSHKRGYEILRALNNVSFEVKPGDFFGIVGRNGSGKSTLLKLLAGIYTPNEGSIVVNGSLTPFIELGVGFNPELTGRENIYLNGALLGFSRTEVNKMYDRIVKFAELEKFMDQKLKNYSSGMQVRLAFSIAIQAKGSILLLDEVLAVGDEAFQRKCFDYFESLKRKKQTVVIVTHDMAAVERFCNRAMLIEQGQVRLIGDPYEVAAAYSRLNDENYKIEEEVVIEDEQKEEDKQEETKSHITIKLLNDKNQPTQKFVAGEYMNVEVSWPQDEAKHVGVAILKQSGEYIFGPNTFWDKFDLQGAKKIRYRVKLNLSEGTYVIKAGLFGRNDAIKVDFEENGGTFAVSRDKNDDRWGGMTKLEHEWILE